MRYFAEVAYLGTNYHGWQSQRNAHTIQDEIEKAFKTFAGRSIKITGSGRTDTGVHAYQQVFHFDMDHAVDENQLCYKLNILLGRDIQIVKIREVNGNAHARFDAEKRAYIYRINPKKNPFLIGQYYQYSKKLELNLMNEAAELLKGQHDFQSFSKVKTDVNNFDCNVFDAKWVEEKGSFEFHISANRFLRGMVRAVVGTLLLVSEKKKTIRDFKNIILSKDRKKAGRSVPPEGLFLSEVIYPESIYKN